MGWAGVWQSAAAQFYAEPPLVALVIVLVVAFTALSALVGLRHVFVFRRYAPAVMETPAVISAITPAPLTSVTAVSPAVLTEDLAKAPVVVETPSAPPEAVPPKAVWQGRKILPPSLRATAKARPAFRSIARKSNP